jgi:hypothetical protein
MQIGGFDRLPERPPQFIQPDSKDPIGTMIENLEEPDVITGTVPPVADDQPGDASELPENGTTSAGSPTALQTVGP